MRNEAFTNDRLAALYDLFSPLDERDDLAFYLPLLLAAESVLDVGCGTGTLLTLAREAGHTGRLVGLDPATGMLQQARRDDIEWVQGDLTTAHWDAAFDLIVMTGHAFQELLGDDELRQAFATLHDALTPAGRFVFETRNPAPHPWERWPERYSGSVTLADGTVVQAVYQPDPPIVGDVVRGHFTYTSPAWDAPLTSGSALRFLTTPALDHFLAAAGLAVAERYGDWQRGPFTATSPEIITFAQRA